MMPADEAASQEEAPSTSLVQPSPGTPSLPDFLCFAIYAANHAIGRVYKPLLDTLGLTYPQYLAMTALWTEDAQTVGAIGQRLFLESSTLTPLLKRLETQGLVTRTRSESDERQVVVRLTPRGDELREKAKDVPGCIEQVVGLDARAFAALRDELKAVRERLDRSALSDVR